MNCGRAETHLRQLAEAELRRATEPGALGRGPAGRLPLVAQALIAVGAVDVGTADQIQAELDLALATRYQAAGMTPQALARLLVSRQFTAADDKGAGDSLGFIFRTGITGSAVWAGVLDLRPDPPHEIGWLDLRTAPGEPATRIRLDPRDPAARGHRDPDGTQPR